MSSWNILELPYVPLHRVFTFMDPIDLFFLAQSSDKALKHIEAHQINASHCNLTMRTTFDKKVAVEIVFSDHLKMVMKIGKKEIGKHYPGFVIEGTIYQIDPLHIDTIFVFTSCPESCIKMCTEQLLSIFPCPVKTVEVETDFFSNLGSFLSWNRLDKCESLKLRAAPRARKNLLERMINGVNMQKAIGVMKYDWNEELESPKLTNLDEVYLRDALWLSAKQFLRMNSKKIELGEVSFGCEVLNQEIRRWLRKEHEKLEHLVVFLDDCSDTENYKILAKLEVQSWNPAKRSRYFRKDALHAYDCSSGWDIYRDDGKIATFLYADHSFNLFIWHQPTQDLSLPRGKFFSKRPNQPILDVKYLTPKIYRSEREAEMDCPVDLSL